MFWKRPQLPPHPEGSLEIPREADPVVQAAVACFNAGDFAGCRSRIREGLERDLPEAQRDILADLQARLRPDFAYLILAAACAGAALFVALWAISISH